MKEEKELSRDILLDFYNVHGKKSRIHQKVTFLAKKRVVEYREQITRQRMLPFLPLKCTETRNYLKIPDSITTEDGLMEYVAEKQPHWMRSYRRSSRRGRA